MPDGSSGLSLSEMGISVKKTGQAVQKTAGSAGQQVKQQFGGSWVPQAPPPVNHPSARPPSETTPKVTGGTFDIAALAKGAKSQLAGNNTQGGTLFQKPSQTWQQPFSAPAAQPPNEFAPKGGMVDEKNPFGSFKPKQQFQQQRQDPQFAAQLEKQKQEDQHKVEALRKKLHDMYFEEFKQKAEGKDTEKKEQEKKKLAPEQEEEEKKKQQKEAIMQETPMLPSSPKKGFLGLKRVKTSILNTLRPKAGSHEGRAGKG